MKSKTKTARKTTTVREREEAAVQTLEGRLVNVKSRLRVMELCLLAHFNLGESIEDVMAELEDLVKACHRDIEAIHQEAPAAVLNWSKADPR